jgi:hypothetical protein
MLHSVILRHIFFYILSPGFLSRQFGRIDDAKSILHNVGPRATEIAC